MSGFTTGGSTDPHFADAKAYLAQVDADGNSLYDHLSGVLYTLLEQRPDNPLSIIDVVSRDLQNEMFKHPRPLENEVETVSSEEEEKQLGVTKLQSSLFAQTAGSAVGSDGGYEDPEVNNGDMPNVMDDMARFEECGVGLGREEALQVQLALKKLVESNPLQRVSFFGKIFGLQSHYYIAQAEYYDGARPIDEEYSQGGEDDGYDNQSEAQYSEYDAQEGNATPQDAPIKPDWQPEPKPPIEDQEGTNKYVYFCCSFPGAPWVRLPDVTPEQIRVARQIRKFFTGDLDAPVDAFPPFPGTERNLLRAQLARITAATAVAPRGRYLSPSEMESTMGEEDDDNASVVSNDMYDATENEDLFTTEGWEHRERFILPQGRCFWWAPPSPELDESQYGSEISGSQMGPEPEVGPYLRTSCAADEPVGDTFAAWTIRVSSELMPRFATVLLQSNRWPGAYAYSRGNATASIYIGNGQKYEPFHYTPPLPPPLMDEYAVDPAISELVDATVEDEDARDAVDNVDGLDGSYCSDSGGYS